MQFHAVDPNLTGNKNHQGICLLCPFDAKRIKGSKVANASPSGRGLPLSLKQKGEAVQLELAYKKTLIKKKHM